MMIRRYAFDVVEAHYRPRARQTQAKRQKSRARRQKLVNWSL